MAKSFETTLFIFRDSKFTLQTSEVSPSIWLKLDDELTIHFMNDEESVANFMNALQLVIYAFGDRKVAKALADVAEDEIPF